MEKLSKEHLIDRFEQLKQKQTENKGTEYRSLWVTVNYAVVRDKHIKRIGARAFGVFMVIRAFMNRETREAYPTLKTIAFLSGCKSIKTIQKEIGVLIENKWLMKAGREKQKNGRFGTTVYRILETDLIRGGGQKGFFEEPLANYATGEQG